MLLEKHILPGTHRGVGRRGMEMWRILVLGVLKQGLGCDFTACTISRTITRRCGLGPQRLRRQDALRGQLDNVSLMRPELLAEVGHWCGERPRGRESLAGGCAGGVTRWCGDRRALSHRFGFTVGWGAVSDPGDGASGGGTRGGRLAATPASGQRVKEGFNPVRSARRGKQTPGSAGVPPARERLAQLLDHARRQIDLSPLTRRTFEPHTRWINRELGVALRSQYQILHHKLCKGCSRLCSRPGLSLPPPRGSRRSRAEQAKADAVGGGASRSRRVRTAPRALRAWLR